MKITKRMFVCFLSLFVAGFLWTVCPFQVHARNTIPGPTFQYFDDYGEYVLKPEDRWTGLKKSNMHIGVKNYAQDFICVMMNTEGYDVRNIKTSGKNLMAWRAGKRTSNHYERDEQQGKPALKKTYNKHDVYIGLFAKKKGNYKVNFDIVDETGKIVVSRTIKIYATNESPFQDIRLNNKKVTLNVWGDYSINRFRFNTSSLKVKVKMTKGYRLKKIEKAWSDKSKKMKNGGSFDLKTCDAIYITYVDKYTGRAKTVKIFFK